MSGYKELKEKGLYKHKNHCTIKCLNNLIEQEHRHVQQRFAKSTGFQSIGHASRILKGIKTVRTLYKPSLQQLNLVISMYNNY